MGNTLHDAVVGVMAGCRGPAAEVPAEAGDLAADVLRDEVAEALRGAGCEGVQAQRWASVMLGVLEKKDRAVAGCGGVDSVAQLDAQEVLRVMTTRLLESPSPRFAVGCLMLAAGFEHNAVVSGRQWAARQGKSHEHAANEVEEWQRVMLLRRTAGQKSEAARMTYRKNNGAMARPPIKPRADK